MRQTAFVAMLILGMVRAGPADAGFMDCDANGVDDLLDTNTAVEEVFLAAAYAEMFELVDLDGDGDADLLSSIGETLRWFEHLDGAGTFSTPVVVETGLTRGVVSAATTTCFVVDVPLVPVPLALVPPAGQTFHYLVRSRNACPGDGSLGADSAGTPRTGLVCD